MQVTTAADGGMGDGWFMRYAQSAEDGALPIIQCSVGTGVESGDFWEPGGMLAATGLPVKKLKLSSVCYVKAAYNSKLSSVCYVKAYTSSLRPHTLVV